jgi:hypothetical protein
VQPAYIFYTVFIQKGMNFLPASITLSLCGFEEEMKEIG